MKELSRPDAFRRTVLMVAILNLSYFGIEFVVAFAIGRGRWRSTSPARSC